MSDSAETNPLPKVSSARAWDALSFPKATPVIREKQVAPTPVRRVRADGTEEICVEDIMVIVPKASAPARKKQPSSEELSDADIVVVAAPLEGADVEVQAPEFRRPAYSINATQEVLVDDVLEVADAPLPPPPEPHRDEIPSTVPWTVDAGDDLEFPTPPKYTGSYPAVGGRRITSYSATQVFRRRSLNVKVVVASVSLAASVVLVGGLARIAPASGSEGPVGISVRAPKKLDDSVRAGTLAYGTAPKLDEGEAVSIDSLPTAPRRYARRWHR